MHNTIQKAGKVLGLFNLTHSGLELSAAEIARQLSEPTSTVHDLLHSMAAIGLLEITGKGRYRLGWELVRLSHLRYFYTQCSAEVHACLQQLAKETALGAHYSLLDNDTWIVVDFVIGAQLGIPTSNPVPLDRPMFWTSGAQTLWAHQPWEHVEQVIAQHGLGANLRNAALLSQSYRQTLERVRQEGFAERIDGEERSLAVPVFHCPLNRPNTHTVVGAITLFGPTQSFGIEPQKTRERLIQASQQLSNQLRKMDDPYATLYPTKST